ncbi:MAG TPA: hypothetical protein DCL76_07530 [Chloroflexi bacterium]|nr:hypothetical protein [Chloroflexota bacterium]|tara:strand:- start:3779 stop:4300 length:522 start_codon:yes stop_codon:yes gene_type:complete
MIALSVLFWMYLLLFGIIGALRGWAKELLVLFSLVLALFLDAVIIKFIPGVATSLALQTEITQFSVRSLLFFLLAFFGYSTPVVAPLFADKARRERLEDMLLGLFLGVINGYLLIGTIWHYLHVSGYPIAGIFPPESQSVLDMLDYMPPELVGPPYIYFGLGITFIFVIVVFL